MPDTRSANFLTLAEKIALVDFLRTQPKEEMARRTLIDICDLCRPVTERVTISNITAIVKELDIPYRRRKGAPSLAADHHSRQAKLAQAIRYMARQLNIEFPEYIDVPLERIAGKLRTSDEPSTPEGNTNNA